MKKKSSRKTWILGLAVVTLLLIVFLNGLGGSSITSISLLGPGIPNSNQEFLNDEGEDPAWSIP